MALQLSSGLVPVSAAPAEKLASASSTATPSVPHENRLFMFNSL
jgi:hypothetical protein